MLRPGVLLVTPVLPRRRAAKLFAARFAAYASHLRLVAEQTGALLLDLDAHPLLTEPAMWASDRVHLRSAGHRHMADAPCHLPPSWRTMRSA